LYCFTCGDERVFEQPPCEDGHGEECPERACADCGSAVLVGPPPAVTAVTAPAPRRASETARARGRAATVRAVA
jgi:DNA-directed RNA polymerase subunit RPC12/RpoP